MTESKIQGALAKRDDTDNTPAGMITKYKADWAMLLPSHVDADQWTRLAIGALRRDPKLMEAAQATPASLMSALANAARLGLEPGTEQFYLTPRKSKGRPEVLGITGYQGLIELIYRAGAVSSVIAEVVYSGDTFEYQPGRDERPTHGIDWDADDRGELRLAYAYAIMGDGSTTSKVVVLNRAEIKRIRASAQGANSEYSPWSTNPAAMWLKSAVRQLAKWVPTSAEFRREQIRAVQEVHREIAAKDLPSVFQAATDDGEHVDPLTGEVMAAGEPVEAEIVDDGEGGRQ